MFASTTRTRVRTSALVAGAAAAITVASPCAAQEYERPAHPWFFVDPSVLGALRTADARLHARVRIDVGPAIVREPHYLSAGYTFEWWSSDRIFMGGYLQYLDGSSGLSAGVIAGADLRATAILGATVGFSWLVLDARVAFDAVTEGWIGLGLRVPLGGILHRVVFDRRPYRLQLPGPARPAPPRAPAPTSNTPVAPVAPVAPSQPVTTPSTP
jgi:hypothetical protein